MSAFRLFLRYPLDAGDELNAPQYSDEVEITTDTLESSLGSLKQELSSNEYAIGTIKFNKIQIKLNNISSKYSEVNNPLSIFTYKRDETRLRIEWDRNHNPAICGSSPCGLTYLSAPITVFEGLLEDNSSTFDAGTQVQTFTFLGLESILGKSEVPLSYIDVLDTIDLSIFHLLYYTRLRYFADIQLSNISVNYNFVPDDFTVLANRTALEVLDQFLFLSGSVLYIKDSTVYVSARDASPTSVFTFYGPSSTLGIENLFEVSEFTLGINRTFNFFTWKGSTVSPVFFQDSIDKFGLRKKEIEGDIVTNLTTQAAIMTALLTEFGFPKKEISITVPMTSEIVANIFLLDKINIDFPADVRENSNDNSVVARYSQARYGESRYARAVSSLLISINTDWKILNRTVLVKNDKIKFKIREA